MFAPKVTEQIYMRIASHESKTVQVTFGASKQVVSVFATVLLLKVPESELRIGLLSAVLCLLLAPDGLTPKS